MATKQYNIEALKERGHGNGPEDGGLGTAGLYRHPESGQEMHTLSDPLFGEAQSNAAVRLGFVRVRDSKPEEIHNILMDQVNSAQGDTDTLKGVTARLNQLEPLVERNKELEKQLEEMRKANEAASPTDSAAVATSTEAAKQAAVDNVQARGQGDTSEVEVPHLDPSTLKTPVTGPNDQVETDPASTLHPDAPRLDGPSDEEKPLTKQNSTELKATAAREGVDTTDLDTNKKLVEAIQKHRDDAEKAKESENE